MEKLMVNKKEQIEQSIEKKKKFIESAPSGRLECHKSRDYYNWYVVNNAKTSYISKSQFEMAEALALKGLYECELRDEEQELKAINAYLKHKSNFARAGKYFDRSPEHRRLLQAYLTSRNNSYTKAWLAENKTDEYFNATGRKHRCCNGMLVRSKSELIIVSALHRHNIPFAYETQREIGRINFHPDFVILRQRDKEEIIWEHFGMMDNRDYVDHNIEKLSRFIRNGYIPYVNFIATFETSESSIDEMWVEQIIETYLK